MIQRGLLLLAIIALTGCSTSPHQSQPLDWPQREAQLRQLVDWQVEGRVAIRTPQDSWSGSLQWQQQADFYDIHISGPFGQGAVALTGDQQRVVLTTSDGDIIGEHGPEQLMYEQLGWQMPIMNLKYWMLGRPNPQDADYNIELDALGRIESLQQGGWLIKYKRYRHFKMFELPAKIFIENHHLNVKLVIDGWQQPNLDTKKL